jgi:hypothetical protein
MIEEFINRLVAKLEGYRFRCQCEADMQLQFGEFLNNEDYSFTRENRITRTERADFTVDIPGGIVVFELKFPKKGGPTVADLRQLMRYAQPNVKALVLVSVRPIAVPPYLAGLPCFNIAIWRNITI